MKHRLMFAFVTVLLIQFPGRASNNESCDTNWNFQSGDALCISALPDTGFPNGIYQIHRNGNVDLPMLGSVKVVPSQRDSFQLLVKQAYVQYLRDPHIQVNRMIRVSLLGGFIKPGLYWICPETTLWNAIYMAGGTINEDGIKKMRWERNGKIVKKKLVTDFESGKTLDEMGFNSGDQISVTSRSKRSPLEIVLQDVIPVLSFVIAIVTTVSVRN
jgi:protein involved in polysaccharide export with SLBB domain